MADALAHFSARDAVQIQPWVVKTPDAVVYLYNGDAGHASQNPDVPGLRHRLLQKKAGEWEYLCEL